MSERIVLRTGEALVEGAEDYLCAEPEVVIGELDGPVGHALANLIGDQVKGHTRVFAILNSDVQVRPATVMVSKVTVKNSEVHEHPDGHRPGGDRPRRARRRPRRRHPQGQGQRPGDHLLRLARPRRSTEVDDLDHKALFDVHREATAKVIRKAMRQRADHRLAAGEPGQGRALLPQAGGGGGVVTAGRQKSRLGWSTTDTPRFATPRRFTSASMPRSRSEGPPPCSCRHTRRGRSSFM